MCQPACAVSACFILYSSTTSNSSGEHQMPASPIACYIVHRANVARGLGKAAMPIFCVGVSLKANNVAFCCWPDVICL